jgi:FixJ family two-component response regulator
VTANPLVGIVDDNRAMRDSLAVLLGVHGFEAITYESGAALLADDRRGSLVFLIVDYEMPGMNGLGVLSALRAEGVSCPAALMTGRLDSDDLTGAQALGIIEVLEQPFPATRVVDLVRRAISS